MSSDQELPGFPLTKFPDEIVWSIIDQIANNVEALSNLCEAVKGNTRLLHPALKKRWQKVIIDDRDLVPTPGDTEFEEIEKRVKRYDFGKKWKTAGHGIHALLQKVRPNLRAAHYVQDLTFNMQMLRYIGPGIANAEIEADGLTPTLASFEHSFALVEPHLLALRTLNWEGDLPERGLTLITQSKYCSKISSLALRQLHCTGKLRRQESPQMQLHPRRRLAINFDSLQYLSRLRSLEIQRLAVKEIPSLLSCLRLLPHLDTLVLADEELDFERPSAACGIRRLVQLLLLHECNEEDREELVSHSLNRLPASLTSLTLMETHDALPGLEPAYVTESDKLDSRLRHLNIIAEGSELVSQFAASFVKAQLKDLMLPGPAFPLQNYQHLENLHSLISKHVTTLSRITLLDAWALDDQFAKNFNQRWQGKYEIRELVLGIACNNWISVPQSDWLQNPSPVLRRYLDGFNGYKPDLPARPDRWGDKIERIRIDDVKSWAIDTAVLGYPRFSQLKIIMLQPFDEGTIPTVEQSTWSFGCKSIDESAAHRLAHQILKDSASKLRVIIIQNYWYWLSTTVPGEENIQLWSWEDAENDSNQAKSMRYVLDADDWAFLRNTTPPLWNARFRTALAIPFNSPYTSESAIVIGRRWNYVTVLPVAV